MPTVPTEPPPPLVGNLWYPSELLESLGVPNPDLRRAKIRSISKGLFVYIIDTNFSTYIKNASLVTASPNSLLYTKDRMSELASKLQQKIKTYKQQIEEAEEIAALNLAKFRHINTISVTDPHFDMGIRLFPFKKVYLGEK